MKVYFFGYPGDVGGANTEAWHTIKLWRQFDVDVHVIPTWHGNTEWNGKLTDLGCHVHDVAPEELATVDGLEKSIVIGMCNSEFITQGHVLRELECRLVWVNCMTFLFDHERTFYKNHGLPEAFVYQSEFQKRELEGQLTKYDYQPHQGFLIHGAFNLNDWSFNPRPHTRREPFFLGRVARPDTDKWSSETWNIYDRVSYGYKRALMLGVDSKTAEKLGEAPPWADCLQPGAISARHFFETLHCTIPINGGARENWPRAGLEAMATGVPIVAQKAWGWNEMIRHGETGFLAEDDNEMAHYAACLAHDEPLRLKVAENARHWAEDACQPEKIWPKWENLFDYVSNL